MKNGPFTFHSAEVSWDETTCRKARQIKPAQRGFSTSRQMHESRIRKVKVFFTEKHLKYTRVLLLLRRLLSMGGQTTNA
jgi:hypothetical protein